MFLRQEKFKMDDFERKENLGSKWKISIFLESTVKNFQAFNGYPCKNSQNIFAHSFVSEHPNNFFYFEKKKTFFSVRGFTYTPPHRTRPL